MISVTMIAIAGKGSFCRYGTREWYSEAFVVAWRKNEGLAALLSTMIDAGGDCEFAIVTDYGPPL
jgi:hypothetical protein